MKHPLSHTLSLALLLLSASLFTSCFSDDTTDASRPLAEISIAKVQDAYNISKNSELTITPAIAQSNTPLTLSYAWEVDQKVVSTSATFRYKATELGKHQCRLIVSNQDGKSFHPFTINVVSPYERGIAILSQDTEGKSMLTFLLDKQSVLGLPEAELNPGMTYTPITTNALTVNNPSLTFSSHAIDMVQAGSTVILACQGTASGDDKAALYYLHNKTFTLQNEVDGSEYPDFIPTHLGIPSADAAGVAYPILCQNGKIYEFSTTEGAIAEPSKFSAEATYSQSCAVWDLGDANFFTLLYWDKQKGGLCMLYNGYGPYYCSTTEKLSRDNIDATNNYFAGQNLVKMVNVNQTSSQARLSKPELLVITALPFGPMYKYNRTLLFTHFWDQDPETKTNYLRTNGGTVSIGAAMSCPINENTPVVANETYNSALFGDGNTLRRWYFTSTQAIDQADRIQTFGSADAVITDLLLSADHMRTYVAVHDPADAPMTGSIYVVSTDDGTIIESYKQVSGRPVRIIHKN